MTRGVLWITWKGDSDPTVALVRSRASVRHWHPELEQRAVEMPAGSNVLCKSEMFDSPFDETLFLDADTTVLGNLEYGFIKAKQHGMALCISANPWNRRYHHIDQHPDEVEYSSGVVFFDKRHAGTRKVFDQWNRNGPRVDSSTRYATDDGMKEQRHNDQALLTLAIQQTGFNPFVLSQNWNLFPKWQRSFFGPVKILHGYDDIPESVLKWNEEQSRDGAVIRAGAWPE